MKKAVAVVIVLTIIVNLIGFGCLAPKAQAIAIVDDAVFAILCVVAGALSGVAANLTTQVISEIPSSVSSAIENNAIKNGELITVAESGGNKYFVPVENLDSDCDEFASFICDYLNQHDVDMMISGYHASNSGLHGQVNVAGSMYELTKTEAVNAFTAYLEGKQREIDMSNFSSFMSELESAMGGVWAPDYEFSFVGPQPDVSISGVSSYKNFTLDGFTFSTPMMFPGYVNGGYLNKAFCTTYAGDHDNNFAGTGFYYIASTNEYGTLKYMFGGGSNTVAVGLYLISNGELYITRSRNSGTVNLANSDYADPFYNQSGVSGSLSAGVPFGFYYTTDTSRSFNYTDLMTALRPDDYFIQSEDIDLAVPLSSDENLVKQWLSVIDPEGTGEHTLEIDSTGAITGVDGVDLTNIESLLTELVNSTYDFSSFEEYLRRIATAAEAAGVNTGYIDDVLDALRAWEQAQDADLDDIKSNVQSIAQALTAAQAAELDLPDLDATAFVASHTGLAEAAAIVSGIPIVNQVSTLINNLLNASQYDNNAPNFCFYWDSDGDGTQELYNAFDLSFLETRLDQNTLADNGRFTNAMTIRQFLHYLIIFICYLAFAIRIIKKLPSLFGGSESSDQFKSESK